MIMAAAGSFGATLRYRAFAVLWTGVLASYMAQWMLALAAQWFLVALAGGADLVPLVQVALTLPMALLAIPAGVLADNTDRRRMIIIVQSCVLAAEIALVVLALTEQLQPAVLLLLLVLVASGAVLTFTPVQSMVPDVVDRESIQAATSLLAVATNFARIIGPAVAGLIIAIVSVGAAFAAALPLTVILLVSMLRWKGRNVRNHSREDFMPAVRSGFRFARHSPQAPKIVLRGLWFTMGIVGLISLLPLLAAGLGAGSADLGLLLAAQGVGAVVGALSLPRLRRYASANRIVAAGFLSAGCAVLASGLATNLLVLGVAVFVSGWAWTGTLATLTAGMQLYLPAWVRARGIAMLLTSIYAGQAVGAVGLGWIATSVGLTWALEVAAVILIGGALLAMWPLKDLSHVDRSAVFGWSAPELVINPNEIGGQVQVRITYTILKAAEREFLTAMHFLRRVRLRTGATRWQLLKDADANHVFIEEFTVSSWAEYQHQRQDRSVASDLALEHAVAELSVEPASTVYLFRVETM